MNIVFKLSGKKDVKKLYVRLYFNKLDIMVPTSIMLMENQWDVQNQSVVDNPELNISLQNLKLDILKQYNKDFCVGILISKEWLLKTIKTSFMRPKTEDKLVNPEYSIYISLFCDYWMLNFADSWKTSARKTMSPVLKSQYQKFIETLKDYEKVIGERLQLRTLSVSDLNSFVEFLETESYQVSTISRTIGRLRFFLSRAIEQNLEVNMSFKQRIYFGDEEEFDGVYLDESEIKRIIAKDFSFDPELEIAKQHYIMLLHTGMRGNDLLKNLDISNFKNDVIKIKTQKTGQTIVVPLHRNVKEVLKSNHGNLPPKMTLTDFNKHIKTICMLCDIDAPMEGKLFDSKKKRKISGTFKKFQLISSHSCRRGFLTLNKGKISDSAICSIMGWSPGSNMLNLYNKVSKEEYANHLANSWGKE